MDTRAMAAANIIATNNAVDGNSGRTIPVNVNVNGLTAEESLSKENMAVIVFVGWYGTRYHPTAGGVAYPGWEDT
jgi:hypothetical protein